jgi:H+/Cl- antiporter ClcA
VGLTEGLSRRWPRAAVTVRRELVDWRVWVTRVVVVGGAIVAGLTVVAFTRMGELALEWFGALEKAYWWSPLLWTPACTALIVWFTNRFAAGAAGSGIPQVMAALESEVGRADRRLFVSFRLSMAKLGLTTMGLLGGLSLGREGPSVQVAAGLMHTARRLLPTRSTVTEHGLLVAGGAAGIAAAFNTPLAGVMFAIEELSRSPEQRSSGLLVSAIVLSGLIAVSIEGNATYFGVISGTNITATLLLPGLLVAVVSGLSGGLFARVLLHSLGSSPNEQLNVWRSRYPVRFAAACGLAVAVIGVITHGATFGSGYEYTRGIIDGTQPASSSFVLLKAVATWLTTWAGVPAGIFAPSLSIGAALGHWIAALTQHPYASTLIALGMVGFLAAVTQAPLTSFIIVMEMVDGHGMVLSLMACALLATGVSRAITRPLYHSLSRFQLARLPARDKALEAPPSPARAGRHAG